MTATALEIWFGERRVGRLSEASGGGLSFRYDRDWLEEGGRALSVSLPVTAAPIVRGAANTYFRGLLPDPPVRERIARKLELSPDDDLALLEALGGECAGAISLLREGVDPTTLRHDYAPLDDADLAAISDPTERVPLLTGRTRATLAGRQHKLPVLLRDGRFFLPVGLAPTTHILKVGDPETAHLPANEAFTTLFARELGLAVPPSWLVATSSEPILCTERFDRVHRGESIHRLHQEDFLQAAGPVPAGVSVSLAGAIDLVRRHCRQPLGDTHRLIVWMTFHLISGDSGADPQNLALVHSDSGLPALAPFYDLVCTRAYRKLDRALRMAIAGEHDPIRIARGHWLSLARELAVKEKTVIDLVARTLDEAQPALARADERFRADHGDHPILRVVPVMQSQITWVRDKLQGHG
jgi:serine/threonine-protein kinase HipA